ncbi:hypothetical protein TNCV_1623411 [Trichonephila clavipes]|nr:hypothetical protein TNCV_1623411 [Trichonephila clavipes]
MERNATEGRNIPGWVSSKKHPVFSRDMISPDCQAGFTASAHAENEGVSELLRHCFPFVLQRQSKLPNRYSW